MKNDWQTRKINKPQVMPELQEAILRHLQNKSINIDKILGKFVSKIYDRKTIEAHIRVLENKSYIKKEDKIIGAFGGGPDDNLKQIGVYTITPLGHNYIARGLSNNTIFSHITNSNVANQSSNVTQSINISEQSQDIQEKIKELELAIIKKDPDKIKKAFGYIADKSVDVAIAILTGIILK